MSFIDSLISGGVAGTCVDLVFFPIDTLKTRLQAKNGFFANGGWKGVYSGVGSTIVASAPGASLFFVCYDQLKKKLKQNTSLSDPSIHMISSSIGEVAACTVRVPSEVIKQRVQTGVHSRSILALKSIISNKNAFKGLYRGFGTTLMREIPFTAIQFPLYEKLKKQVGANEKMYLSSICGMVSGGLAAAVTTPLDVIKTRVMLHKGNGSPLTAFKDVYGEGLSAFFKGVVPRTMWISMGGAVFLGVYEAVKQTMQNSHRLD